MSSDPNATLALLQSVFDRNLKLLTSSVEDFPEASAHTPLVDGGSHLHWLLAHLVASRDGLLVRLGAEPVWSAEVRSIYGRGSSPEAAVTATIAEQIARLGDQQARIEAALATIDDGALATTSGRMSVAAWIEFMAWHETYHLGQVTLYRRAAGLPSVVG